MNKESKMIDKLIEISKQMQSQNEKQFIIQQHEENAWLIIDSDSGSVKDIITKDDVVQYCKRECEYDIFDLCPKSAIDSVWWEVNDDYKLDLVDNYCEEFDKFCAWFDFVCIEFFSNDMVASYKQRLLDFE